MNEKILVLSIFILVYIYLIAYKRYRAVSVWIGVLVVVAAGFGNPLEIIQAINWNVIGIFGGTMILAEFFSLSGVPAVLADYLIGKVRNAGFAMLTVCALSSFLSIAIDNVAVVLIIAPIALQITKKLDISPIPVLIGIAISSNLQGAAILIGDPPSMILAAAMKMNFNDFFFFDGKPGLFFAIQFAAIVSLLVLYTLFRKYKQPVEVKRSDKILSWVPTIWINVMVIGLSFAFIFDEDFLWLSGTICIICAIFVALWGFRANAFESKRILRRFDWDTALFLAGIFALVHLLGEAGLINDFTNFLKGILGEQVFVNFFFVIIFSVFISAFIDNVPYITVMIPVTRQLGEVLPGAEYLLVFTLLIGACLGGNITPIGAAANIVSVSILKKEGHNISFYDFVKIGLPFTIASTAAGALFIYIFFG